MRGPGVSAVSDPRQLLPPLDQLAIKSSPSTNCIYQKLIHARKRGYSKCSATHGPGSQNCSADLYVVNGSCNWGNSLRAGGI